MADNRSTRLRQRVQDFLGDSNGTRFALSKAVYNALNRAQVRICEEANAYEVVGSMNITAGTELYNYPDGMIDEFAIAPGTHGPIVGSAVTQVGYVNGLMEVLVNTTNTAFSWDTAFTKQYTDLYGATVPAYRFIVESARVHGSGIDESVTIVAKSLTGMTLRASTDATVVKFRAEE